MHGPTLAPMVLLALFAALQGAAAQDLDHGKRLAERWCAACHQIDTNPARFRRAPPLAAIAAKDNITAEMIASFLLLPHSTMPNLPLSKKDAADIAAFIMEMRK